MYDEPIVEAIQCEGCEKFALLVKQKNEQIKKLEEFIKDVEIFADRRIDLHEDYRFLMGRAQKVLEGKDDCDRL